ncbi:MAG: hypothetical protein AB8H86_21445, partial [Polyangiales bacterium]
MRVLPQNAWWCLALTLVSCGSTAPVSQGRLAPLVTIPNVDSAPTSVVVSREEWRYSEVGFVVGDPAWTGPGERVLRGVVERPRFADGRAWVLTRE